MCSFTAGKSLVIISSKVDGRCWSTGGAAIAGFKTGVASRVERGWLSVDAKRVAEIRARALGDLFQGPHKEWYI